MTNDAVSVTNLNRQSANRSWATTENKIIFFGDPTEVYEVEEDGFLTFKQSYPDSPSSWPTLLTKLNRNSIQVGSSVSDDWLAMVTWEDSTGTDFELRFIGVDKATGRLSDLSGSPGLPSEPDSVAVKPLGEYSNPNYPAVYDAFPLWDEEAGKIWFFVNYRLYHRSADPEYTGRFAVFSVSWNPNTITAGSLEYITNIECFGHSSSVTPKIDCHPIKLSSGEIVLHISAIPSTSLVDDYRPGSYLVVLNDNGFLEHIKEINSAPTFPGLTSLKALDNDGLLLTHRSDPYPRIYTSGGFEAIPENEHLVPYESLAKTYRWNGTDLIEKDEQPIPAIHPYSLTRVDGGAGAFRAHSSAIQHVDALETVGSNTSGRMIQWVSDDYIASLLPSSFDLDWYRIIWWDWAVDNDLNITIGSSYTISLKDKTTIEPSFFDNISISETRYRWFRKQRPQGFLVYSIEDDFGSDIVLVDPDKL